MSVVKLDSACEFKETCSENARRGDDQRTRRRCMDAVRGWPAHVRQASDGRAHCIATRACAGGGELELASVGCSREHRKSCVGVARLQWQNQYDRQLRSALQRPSDRRGQGSGRPEPGGSFRASRDLGPVEARRPALKKAEDGVEKLHLAFVLLHHRVERVVELGIVRHCTGVCPPSDSAAVSPHAERGSAGAGKEACLSERMTSGAAQHDTTHRKRNLAA